MELKMNEYQLPEKILFNYEELKAELMERVSHYETLVYTDEQIKEAKADKANLNKLKKALNDERIRREKEYMIPFNDFKTKINEIISIIDKPVAVIDSQVKAYEEKQKQDKLAKIKEYYNSIEIPKLKWLGLPAIYSDKWLNASTSMKSIQEEINAKLEQVKKDLATLATLPEFSFEATEVYKRTIDINQAITEAKRMSEMAKEKAKYEAEMKAKEEEQARLQAQAMNQEVHVIQEAQAKEEAPQKQWVSFKALLSTDDARALKAFFDAHGILFEAI